MKDIRLLTKLLGGFIIVALIVLAVGFVGLWGARGLNAEIRSIGTNHLVGIKNLLQVAEAQAQVDAAENTLLQRSLGSGNAQEIFTEFDARKKVIDDSLAVFESLPKSNDELSLWSQFKPAEDAWWKTNQDFIGLSQAYWSSPSDEAFNVMQSQMAQNGRVFGVANGLLQDLVKINDQEANTAVRKGSATGARLQVVSVVGMGAGMALALLLGTFLALSIARPLAKGVEFAALVAGGDFTQKLNIIRRDEVGLLANALNSMVENLRGMLGTIQQSAHEVASSSESISATAVSLSDGAQNQASTLEQTSASMEELTASVNQVSEHAQAQAAVVVQGSGSMALVHKSIEDISRSLGEIAALATQSVQKAEQGAQAVQQVVDGIGLIAEGSEKIGGIVTVISDIADQTNLLALNASIEAARAGEHGRGFAVVADEVSKLADRSSASTKEIEGLIKDSVRNVSRGVETAQGSKSVMEQIRAASESVRQMITGLSESIAGQVEAVKELSRSLDNVSAMSRSISTATEEQTINAKQVSKAVESVNELTQSAAASAEELSGATEQLSEMAQKLQGMVGKFTIARDGKHLTA